ncbi:MAG: hypothetical protein CMN30_32465 [Sandaracinus sp.]|nr:hypothetical protein [Sandaracinus sp.]|tara:strand:+ start:960 stop:2249 length:1290 start_codon:yes stop_codon:yes gene_type:complete
MRFDLGTIPVTLALATAVGALTSGCGAKTGPYVPDQGTNSEFDAGVDLGPQDMGPDMAIPCIEVPFDGGPVDLQLDVEAQVGRADVVFLIDRTASMMDEIGEIRETLRTRLAPAIRTAIPDSEIGVATFADFPVDPYGSRGDGDTPFSLRQRVTNDVAQVQTALATIDLGNGADIQESQVEALYQVVTGEGLDGFIDRSSGCPRGGFGYACFRTDALPVVLLFTDATFHNGPGGAFPYADARVPGAATYDMAVEALRARGARVIGFDSGEVGSGVPAVLSRLARDTETLADGSPLVYDIGTRGQALGTSVVSAIETFAGTVVQDIEVVLSDGDRTDGVDPLELIEAIVAAEAIPPDGVSGTDGAKFLDAQAGTQLFWQVTLRNGAVAPGAGPQRIRVRAVFLGDDRRRLDEELFDIVVPGADGSGCESL